MDDALFQLQRLARQLAERDHEMIDPVEFGEIKGAVSALQLQMSDLKSRQAVMDGKLDQVLTKLSEASGGWKTLMLLGGAAGSLGAALSWVIAHLPRIAS